VGHIVNLYLSTGNLKLKVNFCIPKLKTVVFAFNSYLTESFKNWIACVQDRGKWKDVVEKAKTLN
jgi:hypothetical protein